MPVTYVYRIWKESRSLKKFGIIYDSDAAEDLEAIPNSIFIVYKKVDNCLKDLWKANGSKFSMQDTVQIGVQLLESVENLHSTGYLHLDIKLDNILINRENKVVLIDFGQARKYLLPDGSHCPDTGIEEGGNVHFASLNAFKKQTLSRRDDVIQVIYSLMCLYNEFLPLR